MDADTETRRLSPVAILGDGYLDLINGPQDHGWCSGYTCRKRLSTFQAIVATGKDFLLHYTSVSPQKSRFFLLDAKSDDCITLSVWYSQPWRLDVYHDGKFILPPNARFEGADKRYIIDPPPLGQPDYYKPNATGCTLKSGTSYFNRDTGIITLMIKGPAPVEIITVKTVMVSFQLPSMPENEFYGDKIIMNLASFLNIDASRVRITKIVRETSSVSGRRKRATNKITGVEIEISNPPSSEVNTTASKEDLSSDQLQNITTTIVNDVQLGSSSLKTLINSTGVAISEPPPDPADPNWQTVTKENKESSFEQLVQPSQMRQQGSIVPLHEGAPFSTQPRFQIYDVNGNVVQKLGTLSNPWIITATVRAGTGHSAARMIGSSTAKYHNGWANFTDLGISHYGDDYIVDFNVTSPAVVGYSLSSSKFSLKKRPLKVNVRNITSDIVEDSVINMEVELQDQVTSQVVKEINWRNHSWAVNVSLDGLEYYSGQMSGDRATVFSENTSLAILSNLRFSAQGMVILKIRVTSDPAEYALETDTLINIRKKNLVLSSSSNSSQIELLFEADYDAIVGSRYMLQFQAMMGNYLTKLYPNIILNTVRISKGSIVVTFQVSGNSGQMNSTVDSLCSAVKNRTQFNFRGTPLSLSNYLMVDGVNYHNSQCNSPVIVITKEVQPLPMGIVIAAGAVCLVLLLIIVAAIVWRVKIAPKTKTHTITSPDQIRKTESLSVYRKKDTDNPVNSFVNETYDCVAPADTSLSTFRTSGGSTLSKKDVVE